MSSSFLRPGDVAKKLGVSCNTLRRWEREGKISTVRTHGNHRRFDENVLPERPTITDARQGERSQTTLEKCINPLNAVQDLVLILPSDLIKKLKDKRGDPRGLQWGKNDRYNNKLSNNPRTRFIDVIVESFFTAAPGRTRFL